MTSFVLVGGAWLGAWAWHDVEHELRASGHKAFALTLTGLGDRAHLGNRLTRLSTHVADIAAALEFDDVRDAVLVAHSYGGVPASGAAAHLADRIAHLVYLGASVPEPGGAVVDDWSETGRLWLREEAERRGTGWRLPIFDDVRRLAPDLSEEQEAYLRSHAVAHPLRTFFDRLDPKDDPASLRRTYIRCALDGSQVPARVTRERWDVRSIDSGHWPMITRPADLATLLAELAS